MAMIGLSKTTSGSRSIGSLYQFPHLLDRNKQIITMQNGKAFLQNGSILANESANYPEGYAMLSPGKLNKWNANQGGSIASSQYGTWGNCVLFNGLYVRVVYNNSVGVWGTQYSTDCISWKTSDVNLNVSYMPTLLIVKSKLVVVWYYSSSQYTVGSHSSTDGITWTALAPQTNFSMQVIGAAYNGTIMLAAGLSGNNLISYNDGATFASVASPVSSPSCINYTNGRFILCAATVSTSVDGLTWTAAATLAGATASSYGIYWNGIFFVSSNGNMYTSTNGTTWTTNVVGLTFTKIVEDTDGLIGVNATGVYKSTNGIAWTQVYAGSFNSVSRLPDRTFIGANTIGAPSYTSFDSSIEFGESLNTNTRQIDYIRIK